MKIDFLISDDLALTYDGTANPFFSKHVRIIAAIAVFLDISSRTFYKTLFKFHTIKLFVSIGRFYKNFTKSSVCLHKLNENLVKIFYYKSSLSIKAATDIPIKRIYTYMGKNVKLVQKYGDR